ncbi:STAS domain-containing protein [Streptomyces lateritius]|uniref:STAS domain-containing protein n=1 Tax=Streptomyces lateritius TaxID=67313 RepID=UPI001C8BC818|nr:STAS domain-containing protein [Streptomyces lateritius]MBX9426946.1 STAS domain-containing protein [Streptomyces lateritius]
MRPLPDRSIDLPAPAVDIALQSSAQDPGSPLTVEVAPDGTVVADGEIDIDSAPYLHEALEAALRVHPEGVTLDLSAVTFCDCTGLGAFLDARRRHLAGGSCPLRLGPVSPPMARLLRLTDTEALFAGHATGR